jgi:hypothetical protein
MDIDISAMKQECTEAMEFDSDCMVSVQEIESRTVLALLERLEAAERDAEPVRQALLVPVREKNSQDWASCSGAVAYHLIDRHAEGWADAGLMMEEWADARAIAKGNP